MAKYEEIRKLFNDKKVGVVLAVDETFLRHHECGGVSEVLVPKGTKWLPPTSDANDKEVCTLMMKMDIASSQLLKPKIIFTGAH